MKLFMGVILLVGAIISFSGCEKNDYKHPLHRASEGGDKK